MTVPGVLVDFAVACGARFGADAAGHNDDAAFVRVGDRTIHVNLDLNANRAVVWTELTRPPHAATEVLERAAMEYTDRALLENGLVLGVNRAADLLLLGRSIEQDALYKEAGLDAVAEVAAEAQSAAGALARASDRANGATRT